MSLPHSALSPSGEPVWYELGIRSARALEGMRRGKLTTGQILTPSALRNAMIVHAACGGSSNLILHLTAIAYHAGLKRPRVADWDEVNKLVPRLVDVLPNGPLNHTTAQFFLAGGVPELMLKLRDLDLLALDAMTCTGNALGQNLEDWEHSTRRGNHGLDHRPGKKAHKYTLFSAGKLGSGRFGREKHLDRPLCR
jgi:dihydroxyacid dehydratase/phosphogluconate dehydratase